MLDQNTDRMWFVIGAVIVGAAIIFIANGTLPSLFASVSDSFEESASKGTEVVDEIVSIGANLIQYDAEESFFTPNVSLDHGNGQERVDNIEKTTDYMRVEPKKYYMFETTRPITKRIVYYDADFNYVSGYIISGAVAGSHHWVTTSPDKASYARVAADYKGSGNDWDDVENWEFKRVLQH